MTVRERACEGQLDAFEARSTPEVKRDCFYGQADYHCEMKAQAVMKYFRQRIWVGDGLNPVAKRVEIRYIYMFKLVGIVRRKYITFMQHSSGSEILDRHRTVDIRQTLDPKTVSPNDIIPTLID